ncbi:MAG: hypothetical protein OHK0029_35500 [Armatimonadaceae bacterium]
MDTGSDDIPGLTPGALSIADEFASGEMPLLATLPLGDVSVELREGHDTVWMILRCGKKGKQGGFAVRAMHTPGMRYMVRQMDEAAAGTVTFQANAAMGRFQVTVRVPDPKVALLRCTITLTPVEDLLMPFSPRDLYPLDEKGNPAGTEGRVHAAQRGLNSGLMYLTLEKPQCGSLLYFQNLTALNDYFKATDTKPDGVVGGQWPELGYQPPTAPQAPSPPDKPLPKGQEIVFSDFFLHYHSEIPEDDRATARLFLDLLAGIYVHLERPETIYHDWLKRAEDTIRDLQQSEKATLQHYGARYIYPYTASEYPDSMVQLIVLTPMGEYARWSGDEKVQAFADELFKGMPRFYDKELKTMRRYLPNVGDDKNADEVDSWYLYYPLASLSRLAKVGHEKAREMLFDSLEYGIEVAHKFEYHWPIKFNIKTQEVIQDRRKEHEPGQSDVGGLYAYLMLQAWDLTEDSRYLDEARNAIEAIEHLGFEIAYQMNLTAWGVNACVRLWRITQKPRYREMALVFLANYMHNSILWESELANAAHYQTFYAVTCLHDATYAAAYECFESVAAFTETLSLGQDDLPESVRLLLAEFYKYALSRVWYFYPSELPEEALAQEIRNGHIDRALSFPLEDLYPDGQPAGQVGQELYGCGAAFALASRAYHHTESTPFLMFCEYPLSDLEQSEPGRLFFQVRGAHGFNCKVRLIPRGSKPLPSLELYEEEAIQAPDRVIPGTLTEEGHCEYIVPANRRLQFHWET